MSDKKQIEPKPGYNSDYGFETKSGVVPSIQVNVQKKLSPDRILVALKRLREKVSSSKLSGYDDTTVGCKNTECEWGLCSDSPKLWSDAQDHIFPYEFLNRERVTPLQSKGVCPLQVESDNSSGCFHSCRFFQSRKYRAEWPQLDKDSVLARIDAKISELEKGEDDETETKF